LKPETGSGLASGASTPVPLVPDVYIAHQPLDDRQ
jgi:hypothetical protein